MVEWLNALLFGVAVITLVLGLSSIIMGAITDKEGAAAMTERIEYGYMGVSALVICGLMVYLLL
jgi:Mg2+/Co2+ transporter CorB